MPVFVPSTAAPTHVGRFRAAAVQAEVAGGLALDLGVPFLPGIFGPGAAIAVEAAFGADVNADPSSWTWYDITGDVRQADGGGISITPMGRADETSTAQPAGCGFELANDSGDYTAYSSASRWWPFVRRNTPIRVRINLTGLAGDWVVRFQGESTGWKPSWDVSAALPVVTVAATGVTRRLSQGKNPLLSAMRRSFDFDPVRPVAYWPLEGGKDATVLYDVISNAPTVFGPPALTIDDNAGAARFGTVDIGDGSLPVANISGGGKLYLNLPKVSATGQITWQWSMSFGTTTRTGTYMSAGLILDPSTAPVHLEWAITMYDEGHARLICYELDANDNIVGGTLDTTFAGAENLFDGQPRQMQLNLTASGGTNILWSLYENDTTLLGSGTLTPSFSGAMNAPPWRVSSLSTTGASKTLGYGHVAVYTTNITPNRYDALNAHRGETATDRLARLCAERGVAITIAGTSTTTMGPQSVDAFLPLLRECETADQGVLYDGLGPGLSYVTRDARYNATAALTIDAAARQLDDPFEPVDDDQRDINAAMVSRKNGSSYTYQQTTGAKGTDAIGLYDTAPTVNVDSDGVLPFYASWLTHLGTIEGFRYPRLNLDLRSASAIAAGWLAAGISGRIDVTNVASVATEHPAGTVRLLLEGWAEQLTPFVWTAQANTSQYDGWQVGVLAMDTGDSNPLLGHLDTDGATVAAAVDPAQFFTDGFESGIGLWATQNGWTAVADATHVHAGVSAMMLTPPGATASGGALTVAGRPCTAGGLYVVECWFWSAAGWTDCRAAVDWYDASNVFISSSLGSATSVPASTWTVSRQTFTAPAGATTGKPRARQGGTPAVTDVLWVDDVAFYPQIIVATPTGPIWTTAADDFPLDVLIGGQRISIASISGATSPQTFNVDPTGSQVLYAIPAGAQVGVADPIIPAL